MFGLQVKKLQPTWRIVTRTYWLQFFIELRNFKPNKNKRQAIPASLCAMLWRQCIYQPTDMKRTDCFHSCLNFWHRFASKFLNEKMTKQLLLLLTFAISTVAFSQTVSINFSSKDTVANQVGFLQSIDQTNPPDSLFLKQDRTIGEGDFKHQIFTAELLQLSTQSLSS